MANAAEYEAKMGDLLDYFSKGKDDPILLTKISNEPIEVLRTLGMEVDEQFKDAVSQQIQGFANLTSLKVSETIPAINEPASDGVIPDDVKNALRFAIQPWGVVLVVEQPAVQFVQDGGSITTGVLGMVAGGATIFNAVPVSLVCGIAAAAIAISKGVMSLTNQGKGVYFTWTWAQFSPYIIFLIPNPMYGIPVITPIK